MERLIRYLLPFLSLWALYAIFDFFSRNGFFALLQQSIKDRTLPETEEPLKTDITGLRFLDEFLASLTPFFWPAINGSMPGLSLHVLNFLGALAAAWVLVYLESLRVANQYRLVMLWVWSPLVFQCLCARLLEVTEEDPDSVQCLNIWHDGSDNVLCTDDADLSYTPSLHVTNRISTLSGQYCYFSAQTKSHTI